MIDGVYTNTVNSSSLNQHGTYFLYLCICLECLCHFAVYEGTSRYLGALSSNIAYGLVASDAISFHLKVMEEVIFAQMTLMVIQSKII